MAFGLFTFLEIGATKNLKLYKIVLSFFFFLGFVGFGIWVIKFEPMDSTLGGKAHQSYGPVMLDLKVVGKRIMEWGLTDWNWNWHWHTSTVALPPTGLVERLVGVGGRD